MPSLDNSTEVVVSVDSKGNTTGIDKVEQSLGGLDKRASTLSKGIKFLNDNLAGAVGIASGFGAAVGGIAGFALKSASSMETLRANMNILTGSVDKGGKVYKDLVDFANRTPFETSDLAQASSTMMSFGISSDKVMDTLKVLGDVSLGNKDKLQGLALAYSQVQSTGHLMGQDLLQMVNQGFNPLQIISQKTGASMEDLKKAMEDGSISADMVTEAFKSATAEGGLFHDGMKIGAETTEGKLSTLSDAVQTLARGIVGLDDAGNIVSGGLLDKFKGGVQALTDVIANNKDTIIGFTDDLLDRFSKNQTAILAVAGAVGGVLAAALVLLAETAGPALIVLGALSAAGAAVGLAFGFVKDHIDEAKGSMDRFQPAIDFVRKELQDTWSVIQTDLLPALGGLWDEIAPTLIPALKLLGSILGTTLLVGFTVVIEQVQHFVQTISPAIAILSVLVNWLKEAAKYAVSLGESFSNSILGKLSAGTTNLAGLFGGIKSFLPHFADGVTNFQGGLAVVGERGPEIAYLPQGTSVVPNGQAPAGNTYTMNFHQEFHRDSDPIAFARELGYQLSMR